MGIRYVISFSNLLKTAKHSHKVGKKVMVSFTLSKWKKLPLSAHQKNTVSFKLIKNVMAHPICPPGEKNERSLTYIIHNTHPFAVLPNPVWPKDKFKVQTVAKYYEK